MACCLLVLSGCVRVAGGPAPTVTAGPGCDDPTIFFSQSGGIAGVDDRVVIDPTGEATITRRGETRTVQLDSADLDRLRRDLERADLASIATTPGAPPKGADFFQYRLTYCDRTATFNSASGIPDLLQPVTRRLIELIAQ